MKNFIKFLCILGYLFIILDSCAWLYNPHKPSKFEPVTRYWMKQRSDGYWIVTYQKGFMPMKETIFECKPDSAQLSNL